MDIEEKQKAFKDRFTHTALTTPGVESVKFFGSFDTPRWRIGKSDIDIFVGGKVSSEDKKMLRKEVIHLNDVYQLDLEDSCYLHPTPVFEDDKVTGKEFKALSEGQPLPHGKIFTELGGYYRPIMKKLCIPHKTVWKLFLEAGEK